ncbi:MAG: peptide MFS transporter [Acidobacteriota bacterium]
MPKDPSTEFARGEAAEAAGEQTSAAGAGKSFFGHPRGLATLFFTELWERFSYYGMRAILILFMTAPVATGGLAFDITTAGAIYGLYTASVYLLALPGGWVADRLMGQRYSVLLGGIIIACGHFSMAYPVIGTFYLGLVLIAVGTGLLKPNVSAMVGDLYPEGGARRDAGYSIYYMGINIGAFISPLVCGFLGQRIDWHLGFAAAGIGMVLGIIQYLMGAKYLGRAGLLEKAPLESRHDARRRRDIRSLILGIAVVAVPVLLMATGVLNLSIVELANAGGIFIVGLAVVYFIVTLASRDLKKTERKRIIVIFILFIAAALFWGAFEQAGSSLNLFAEHQTDMSILGYEFPASWLQSINPIFIIIMAPVFAWLWVALGRYEPSSPAKFAFGLVFAGLGFLVMAWAAIRSQGGSPVSPMWLIVTYFLHTTGELALSPVGLSTVTKLSPHRLVGQMMGVWFMASALGNLMAGRVAGFMETLPLSDIFGAVFLTTTIAGLVLALLSKPITRLMSGVK